VLSAWTVFELVRRVRGGRPGRASLVLTILAAAIFCSIPAFGVRAPVDFDLDYKLGYAWQQKGDLDAALASYREAIRRHPHNALAYNALGLLLAARGNDLAAAAQAVQTALDLDPGRAAHYAESLAGIELQRGRIEAALLACSLGLAAAPEAPTRAALHLRQAEAHRARGDAQAESVALRAALDAGVADAAAATSARQRLAALVAAPATPPSRR
jgi:tetratricopeptide (TPR) repeat protein